MRMRAPSVPLITTDPFFDVWSPADCLTDADTVHWTNLSSAERKIIMRGTVTVDGMKYRFMGENEDGKEIPALKQISLDIDAFSSTYVFEGAGISLEAKFTTPVIPSDIYYLTRPVSYLRLSAASKDGKEHDIIASVAVSEQICLDKAGESEVTFSKFDIVGKPTVRMGNKVQNVLGKEGDDMRINWGCFYLTAEHGEVSCYNDGKINFACAEGKIEDSLLFSFAYDDIKSIKYFGEELPSYWNRGGEKIESEIAKAFGDYEILLEKCGRFSDKLFSDAVKAGGEKYAEILLLSLRQTVAAHKAVIDGDGELVYISKECFSNGCAATVDVSYPSIPMFLIYNPELIRGMMRPIYKFAESDMWDFDFAPHDVGTYPIIDRQRYGIDKEGSTKYDPNMHMPVEECGNMIIMEAVTAVASGDFSFAESHLDMLSTWVKYLIRFGKDPENQLCTDDFAGHLAHNCNLSLKAIMGIACYGIILSGTKKTDADGRKGGEYIEKAREYALDWINRAQNSDGTFRLAFDKPESHSMKYNIVWDKLLRTEIMPKNAFLAEINGYKKDTNIFGLPLDTRSSYTKSDWLIWVATLAESRDDFEAVANPLWEFYNITVDRVPLTDWYNTDTGTKAGWFQHRSVVGGHFIKLLEYYKVLEK